MSLVRLARVLAAPRAIGARALSAAPSFSGETADLYEVVMAQHAQPNGPWPLVVEEVRDALPENHEATVLDLGSGPGEPALTIATTFPGLDVLCTDVAPDMVAKARVRTDACDNIRCEELDMQDMHLVSNDSINIVTCVFGLMFPADKKKALAEIYRVLRPGGVLIATWPTEMKMLDATKVVMEAAVGGPPPPMPMDPLALKEPFLLARMLTDAGLVVTKTRESEYDFFLGKDEELAFKIATIPLAGSLEELATSRGRGSLLGALGHHMSGEDVSSKARKAFAHFLDEHGLRRADGEIVIGPAKFGLIVAEKPGGEKKEKKD